MTAEAVQHGTLSFWERVWGSIPLQCGTDQQLDSRATCSTFLAALPVCRTYFRRASARSPTCAPRGTIQSTPRLPEKKVSENDGLIGMPLGRGRGLRSGTLQGGEHSLPFAHPDV